MTRLHCNGAGALEGLPCPHTPPMTVDVMDDRFGLFLLGYNTAHHDLLEATGPGSIKYTGEADTYEIEIRCGTSASTLTAVVVSDGDQFRLTPIDFRTTFRLPFMPVFSYDRASTDAPLVRMMTGWLEKIFMIHEATILESIRAGSVANL